jgi:hypothetical protein
MSHGRDVAQLAAMQTGRNDPWHERRASDPVLRAVIGVLAEHTQVSYDVVDWRGHLFGAGCPAEQAHVDRGLVQDPRRVLRQSEHPLQRGRRRLPGALRQGPRRARRRGGHERLCGHPGAAARLL